MPHLMPHAINFMTKSGNYAGWKAQAIGANSQGAQSILKTDYKDEEMKLDDALILAVKVLSKSMDTTSPTTDKVEISTPTRDENGKVVFHVYTKAELESVLKRAEPILKELKDADSGDM